MLLVHPRVLSVRNATVSHPPKTSNRPGAYTQANIAGVEIPPRASDDKAACIRQESQFLPSPTAQVSGIIIPRSHSPSCFPLLLPTSPPPPPRKKKNKASLQNTVSRCLGTENVIKSPSVRPEEKKQKQKHTHNQTESRKKTRSARSDEMNQENGTGLFSSLTAAGELAHETLLLHQRSQPFLQARRLDVTLTLFEGLLEALNRAADAANLSVGPSRDSVLTARPLELVQRDSQRARRCQTEFSRSRRARYIQSREDQREGVTAIVVCCGVTVTISVGFAACTVLSSRGGQIFREKMNWDETKLAQNTAVVLTRGGQRRASTPVKFIYFYNRMVPNCGAHRVLS